VASLRRKLPLGLWDDRLKRLNCRNDGAAVTLAANQEGRMPAIRGFGGMVAAVALSLAAPAAAVTGHYIFEYRNGRTDVTEIQRTTLTGGGTASSAFAEVAAIAEAAASGTVSTGRVQVSSSLAVDRRGFPFPDQEFLDSIATASVSHNIMVANAPVSAGFLEIAFAYSTNVTSNLPKPPDPPGYAFTGQSYSANFYLPERSISSYIEGYTEVTYQTINGFTFPVYTFVNDLRFFNANSRQLIAEAIGTRPNANTIRRTLGELSGFASGQVIRVPFITGRNMLIALQAVCQVRTQDQRLESAAGTCDNSFGWGGLLGAVDMDGNAIPLDQIDLLGYKPFFSDAVPLDFDPYANLSGIAFTPIPFANPVPEPANWALLIAGFGLIGGLQRRQRVRFAMGPGAGYRFVGYRFGCNRSRLSRTRSQNAAPRLLSSAI
jgi:hypothetical protein